MPQIRLRILFNAGDTLPEVGRDLVKLAMTLAQEHPRHQYILAIQPSALHWNDLDTTGQIRYCVLAIQPLTQRGIRHALEVQGEPGQKLLDALYDTSLFDLASTGFFFVKMLTSTQKGQTPSSRAEVLQKLIDNAIAQVPADQGMRANAPRTLLHMALEMQRSDLTVWPIGEVFRVMSTIRGERGYAVEELYASLVRQQLLVPVGEEAMRFAYHSIQAYCCAQAILAQPDRDRTLRELVDSLGSPVRTRWWEETLIIASGLLATDPRPDAQQALRCLLEPIIYGKDLLESTRLFVGARCLLECRTALNPEAHEKLQKLSDHVVNALRWRSDSATEPDLNRRLEATQLLAQLAMPEVAVDLARKAYDRVRLNIANQWDYEFSSVRYAAAIALKRMEEDAVTVVLRQISPKLTELFAAWKHKDIDTLMQHSADADDLGLQSLAALALGDLHGSLESANRPDDARRVLDRLNEMFTSGETRQGVRWSVADALSLLDSARVTQAVVTPLLAELSNPAGTSLRNPAKVRKSLAYLIGLLRLRDKSAHDFLLQDCLGFDGKEGSKDWSTWATAITALGRVAVESDMKLLAELAAGRAKGKDLQAVFLQEVQRNYIRREALNALANYGDLVVLCPEDRDCIAKEPALSKAYYQAIQQIYWRREAIARAILGGSL
ncbi:MAG: hypothetical protein JXR84_11355 [Anaerolineae bacterium]|nr:hypothetical protein [Anaerolineae bacterium]